MPEDRVDVEFLEERGVLELRLEAHPRLEWRRGHVDVVEPRQRGRCRTLRRRWWRPLAAQDEGGDDRQRSGEEQKQEPPPRHDARPYSARPRFASAKVRRWNCGCRIPITGD